MDDSAGPLAALTTLRVGGPARRIVTAGTAAEITAALRSAGDDPLLVLGGGSNVVISDRGHAGTVLLVKGGRITASDDGDARRFVVDAGVDWDEFVAEAVRHGGTGVELLSGIPGRVGAAPMQNISAYGQQVCHVIEAVEVVERTTGETAVIPEADCGFGFRSSHFKHDWAGRYVITAVHFRIPDQRTHPPAPSTYTDIVRHFEAGGSPTAVADRRAAVLTVRRRKAMVLDPLDPDARSAGSFFINPHVPDALADELEQRFDAIGLRVNYPEGRAAATPSGLRRIPAAHLLRASGFNRGDSWGSVALSNKHVLAIVTRDGATADDVWFVGNRIREQVAESTGITLEFEPQFVGTFPPYNRATFDAAYTYEPAPAGEPDWLQNLR